MAANMVAVVAKHQSQAIKWAQEKGYQLFSDTMWRDEMGRMQCYMGSVEIAKAFKPVLVIALPDASSSKHYYDILEVFVRQEVPITYL